MEKILDAAQYIFSEYKNISGENIDQLKLHKLLYLTQRESLAITGNPMFSEEFKGWKFGPVCPEVRRCYTGSGITLGDSNNISYENRYIIKNIILQYGGYESWKLSELSHREISWNKSREGVPAGENGNKKLLLDDIRKDAEKVRPYDSVWDMYLDEFEDYYADR